MRSRLCWQVWLSACCIKQGKNINAVLNESDFKVSVGEVECVVKTVTSSQLMCLPSEQEVIPPTASVEVSVWRSTKVVVVIWHLQCLTLFPNVFVALSKYWSLKVWFQSIDHSLLYLEFKSRLVSVVNFLNDTGVGMPPFQNFRTPLGLKYAIAKIFYPSEGRLHWIGFCHGRNLCGIQTKVVYLSWVHRLLGAHRELQHSRRWFEIRFFGERFHVFNDNCSYRCGGNLSSDNYRNLSCISEKDKGKRKSRKTLHQPNEHSGGSRCNWVQRR